MNCIYLMKKIILTIEKQEIVHLFIKRFYCWWTINYFTRYHEAFKTFIRGGNKLCKKIIGYDANALYLWAISQFMPTGKHKHIKQCNLSQ